MKQIRALEAEALSSKKNLQGQIDALTKELSDLELKYKVSIHDYETEIKTLSDQCIETQTIRSQLSAKLHESEEMLKLNSKDMEKKYIQKIRELEDTCEAIKDRSQSEIREN